MSASGTTAGAPRGPQALRVGLAAFQHRNFRLFWAGQLLSLVGTWMQSVAQSWLVLDLTNSPFQVGVVVGLQFGPVLLLGLLGGVVADRCNKRRALLVTQTAALLQALVLGLLVVSGRAQVHHVWLLAISLGVVNAFDIPLRQSFVMELVGRRDVMNALALNSSAFNLARVVGPAVGGLVIGRLGVGPAFLTNAASFVFVLASLLGIRERDLHARPPASGGTVLANLREGLDYVRRTPIIYVATALVGLSATFGMNFSVLLSVIARDQLGIGSFGFGLLMASVGIGAVAAALFIATRPRLSPTRTMVAGGFGFAILELAFATAAHYGYRPLAFAFLLGVGFCMILITAMTNTALQQTAPDALRGRVMSVYVAIFSGSTPLGGLLSGWTAKHLGADVAFGIGACLAGVSTLWAAGRLRATGLLPLRTRNAAPAD